MYLPHVHLQVVAEIEGAVTIVIDHEREITAASAILSAASAAAGDVAEVRLMNIVNLEMFMPK